MLFEPYEKGEKKKKTLRCSIARRFTLLNIVLLMTFSGVYAQDGKISLNLKNVSVEKVLQEIKKQSDFDFIYDADLIAKLPKVSLDLKDTSVENILNACLRGSNVVGYKINKEVIMLVPSNEAQIKAVEKQETPKFPIVGKVTDKDGFPLPGATVLEDGTYNGVTTNADGTYRLSVADKNSLLRVSYIGFATQVINIAGRSEINVVMEESTSTLSEVVVTGYSKIAKERATGSFFQLKEDELKKQVTTSFVDRLEGITTGLLFTTENGDGGDRTKITLRGAGAFYSDVQPLIVVDGFPIEGDIESVNPNDIESINILQDAAAASIYGIKSSGGVIVITTKTGKKGEIEVDYSSYFTIETKPDLEDTQIASSESLVDYIGMAIETGTDGNYSGYAPVYNAVEQVYADHWDGTSMSSEGLTKLNKLKNTDVFDQYSDLMLRNAFSQQHNLSVRGGGEHNRYYFSTSYNNDQSVEIGDKSNRLSILLNNDIDISSKFHVHTGMNVTYRKSWRNAEGLGLIQGISTNFQGLPRFQALVDEQGNRLRIPRGINEDVKQQYEELGYLDWGWNPLDEIENKDITNKSMDLRLNLGLTYNILPSLSWELKGQYETSSFETRNFKNLLTYDARDEINRYTIIDGGKLIYQVPKAGILDRDMAESKTYTIRTQFNFDKIIADVHQITALVGMEGREYNAEGSFDRFYGYDDITGLYNTQMNWGELAENVTMYNGSTYGSITNPAKLTFAKFRDVSSFMNMAYTYKSKYTFTTSGKIDQTTLFGGDKNLRRNLLWSFGAAWIISEESFFTMDFVDHLKLRASYGVNGNIQPGATAFTTYYSWQDWTTSEFVLRTRRLGNPNIKHEDTFNFNAAIDFSLFDSKLSGSFEYYNKKSVDLLAQFKVNPTYGFSNQFLNRGEIRNSGIALNLNAVILNKKDFNWSTTLNLTYNKNKVISFENDQNTATGLLLFTGYDDPAFAQYIVDEDVSAIYAYRWAGLSESGLPQVYNENGEIVGIDGEVGPEALVVAGQLNPPVYGGLSNTFRYKNLSLSVLLTYKLGHVFRRPSHASASGASEQFHKAEFHKDIDLMWQEPGDEKFTDVPKHLLPSDYSGYTQSTNYSYYSRYGDHLIEDASYIRIRQVSLDYSLDGKTLEKLGLPFKGVRFTAQVRNLGMLWKANKYDIDPDVIPFSGGARILGGTSGDQLVVSRPGFKPKPVYTFGVNVQL